MFLEFGKDEERINTDSPAKNALTKNVRASGAGRTCKQAAAPPLETVAVC